MKKLFSLGDMHFSNSREWDLESFENFINWFEKYDFGPKEENELLQLGDVTEKSINDGKPIELLTRWANIALTKFSKIYILGGNHCHRRDNGNKSQYSSQYLEALSDNIKVIYEESIFATECGLNVLALPHQFTLSTLEKHYNEELSERFYTEPVDLICGHVNIYDAEFPYIDGVDISKFNYKMAVFGHIHQRTGKFGKYYTGSIMPFRKSEEATDLPRAMRVFTKDGEIDSVELPEFRRYKTIDFMKEKPEIQKGTSQIVYIYELENCRDRTSAKAMYGDKYYIRFGKNKSITDIDENSEKSASSIKKIFSSHWEAFQQMCKDMEIKPKRKTFAILKQLLDK